MFDFKFNMIVVIMCKILRKYSVKYLENKQKMKKNDFFVEKKCVKG